MEFSAANDRLDEGFSTRALARVIGWDCLWPALTNLSGRKPRGLGVVYGERASWVGSVPATEAWILVLKAAYHEVGE